MDSGTYRDTPTWADTGERGTVTAPGRGDGRRGPRPVDRPPGIFYRPARPTGDDRPGRWILAAAFWAGLIAAVAPWWFNTPSSALSNTAAALIAAGRITGLITGYVLLVQVLLMS